MRQARQQICWRMLTCSDSHFWKSLPPFVAPKRADTPEDDQSVVVFQGDALPKELAASGNATDTRLTRLVVRRATNGIERKYMTPPMTGASFREQTLPQKGRLASISWKQTRQTSKTVRHLPERCKNQCYHHLVPCGGIVSRTHEKLSGSSRCLLSLCSSQQE